MVPNPDNKLPTRRFSRQTQTRSSSNALPASFCASPAAVTYGKNDTKLLSLRAEQFKPDVYTIPPNDENDDHSNRPSSSGPSLSKSSDVLRTSRVLESSIQVPRPLKKQRVSTPNTSTASTRSGNPRLSEIPLTSRVAESSRHIPRPLKKRRASTEKSVQAQNQTGGPEPSATSLASRGQKSSLQQMSKTARRGLQTIDAVELMKRKTENGSASKAEASKAKRLERNGQTAAARRLPVNELFLVTSPMDYGNEIGDDSAVPGIHGQDPIKTSSVPQVQPYEGENEENLEAPLSVIRQRLRTPARLCRKRHTFSDSAGFAVRADLRGRDGFEQAEVSVTPAETIRRRKQHRQFTPSLPMLRPLQLTTGPLPDVTFVEPTTELKLEPGTTEVRGAYDDFEDPDISPAGNQHGKGERASSFRDREKGRMIYAQLSSISAPAREPSESEESEGDSHCSR